jgi:hypothetical protein
MDDVNRPAAVDPPQLVQQGGRIVPQVAGDLGPVALREVIAYHGSMHPHPFLQINSIVAVAPGQYVHHMSPSANPVAS